MMQEGAQNQIPPQVQEQMQKLQEDAKKLAEENQALKQDASIDVAKVNAQKQAQDAKLAMEAQAQTERQRLAREEFEFKKRLEVDLANHKIDLAEREAAAEAKLQTQKLAFERECRLEEAKRETAVQ